jgi:hypothetical protein
MWMAVAPQASAALSGWSYQATVTVTNGGGTALTNHQVNLTLNTAGLVTAGQMQADGDDMRFLDSDDTTVLSYWIESGMNTASTSIWVNIPSIPGAGKTLFLYYGNASATAGSSLSSTMVLGETGITTASSSYTTVTLANTYTAPVVVATPVEGSDNVDVATRVRNVTTTSFQVKLHQAGGTAFNATTVPYLVLETGRHQPLTGTLLLEANTASVSTEVGQNDGVADAWTAVTTQHTFPATPVVFAQGQTENDTGWVTEALRSFATSGFEWTLERVELSGSHAAETLGYIAMTRDLTGTINGNPFETRRTANSVQGHDNGNLTYTYTQTFADAPVVLLDLQSRPSNNGAWVVTESGSTTQAVMHGEEDSVFDVERSHGNARASLVAFEQENTLILRKYATTQPTATVTLPISKLVFTSSAPTVKQGNVTSVITLQTQNALSAAQPVSSETTIALTSTSAGGEFSLSASPFSSVTNVTISSGSSTATFYYRDSIAGTPTITIAESPSQGWTDGTQALSVNTATFLGDYKRPVTVDNSTGALCTNNQVLLPVDTATLIASGKMQADGDDIRFTDSDDLTALNYWLESGINTTTTRIWVKLPSTPAASSKTIYLYYGNASATAGSNLTATMVNAEVGSTSATDSFGTIALLGTYTSPVVVASYVEAGDDLDVSTRIRNVGSSSFQLRMQRPSGTAGTNTVNYLVVENGRHQTVEGELVEAAAFSSNALAGAGVSFSTVTYSHSFSAAPVVFSQAQSENSSTWVTEAIRNVGTGTFQTSLERAEIAGGHAAETLGWIAMQNSQTGAANGLTYETRTSGDNVRGHTNGTYTTTFSTTFASAPTVMNEQRRRDEADGGWATIDSVNTTQVIQHIEEDSVTDAERSHTTEDTSLWAFGTTGLFPLRAHACASSASATAGTESPAITQLAFTSGVQTIRQNQVSSAITMQTQAADNTALAVSADTTLDLTSSSAGGQFATSSSFSSTITQVTLPSGQHTVTVYYRDTNVGSPTLTVSETPSQGWTDATQQWTLLAAPSSFRVTATSPQTVGSSFAMTVTALASNGTPLTTFAGTVNLSVNYIAPVAGSGTLGTTATASFTNGVATMSSQTYSECGTITIKATQSDDSSKTGTSESVVFVPRSFGLVASALEHSSAAQHVVNKPFTLTVTAKKADGSTCTGYQGTATLGVTEVTPASAQGGSVSVTSLTAAHWTAGVSTLIDLTYNRWGTVQLICAASGVSSATGSSSAVTFLPKDLQVVPATPPASRAFYYVDELFSTTVTARDYADAPVPNYQGTIAFTGSGLTLPDNYPFVLTDLGAHLFEGLSAASALDDAAVTTTDTAQATVTGTSKAFDVKAGTITVFSNQGPIGSTVLLTVRALDSAGELLSTDDSTTFTVTLTESTEDDSATATATRTPVTLTDGTATLDVTDTTAETVTVTPASTPVLTAVPGTATFGTVAGTGVGVNLWREKRDAPEPPTPE